MPSRLAFFGYGSLVNELTWARRYEMIPAQLAGWKREWKHCVVTPWGPVCALTAVPKPGSSIHGVFIKSDAAELAVLDEREIGYTRLELDRSLIRTTDEELPESLFIYTSQAEAYRHGSVHFPLWMSYIEVVTYGFWRVFGENGVDEYIHSTGGWEAPIIDDRTRPRYPRMMSLTGEERAFIERKIMAIDGTHFLKDAVI
jgi:glutathione-specific gamma-glutamylcyclotransferase